MTLRRIVVDIDPSPFVAGGAGVITTTDYREVEFRLSFESGAKLGFRQYVRLGDLEGDIFGYLMRDIEARIRNAYQQEKAELDLASRERARTILREGHGD